MNGIKKVFSANRNSSSSSDVNDETFSSQGNNTVESRERNSLSGGHSNGKVVGSHGGASNTGPTVATTTGTTGVSNGASATGTGAHDAKLGRSQAVATRDGQLNHSHENSTGEVDLTKGNVHQTVEHAAEVVTKTHHHHSIEEVERQRQLEKHQHHIQVLHQPVKEEEHTQEQIHQKIHPVTHINEKHMSTDKDAKLLASVANSHGRQNEVRHATHDRQIIDQGEVVNENVHTHIHNVVIPLVDHDVHEHHRIKTVIPTHHVLHEAPIIHESTVLKPVSRADFEKSGGVLGSSLKEVEKGVLSHGQCERSVDGVAETLAKDLHLKKSPLDAAAPTATY